MNIPTHLENFVAGLPKAELHLHIEGTFEPELIFKIAQRNQVELKFPDVESLRAAYSFTDLQSFLDIYYEGAGVLLKEQDFYDLTMAYMERLHEQNCRHIELFFDPQTHTDRGVPFAYVIDGIWNALQDAEEKFGISSYLIMSYLRHLSEEAAFETLEQSLPYRDRIIGIGLDSSELGNPPSKFERVFAKSREYGYRLMAHAGEEGPAAYIYEALDLLDIDRLDHGNRCMDDDLLVERLAREQMALTVCPISNRELKVVPNLKDHPMKEMLNRGLLVTTNSDDPAYFRGSLNENYTELAVALDLDYKDLYQLAHNSFVASFLPDQRKAELLGELEAYCSDFF